MTISRPPRAFKTAAAFRAWLAKNHDTATELLVRVYKTHAADQGMTNGEAVEEALCYGWIDGVRRRLDEVSFSVRFSPRKPASIWSNVNVRKVEALIAAGRMAEPGLAAFGRRDRARTGIYSFERAAMRLRSDYEKQLRANKAAWKFFEGQAPWYQRITVFWVMSAKREETQRRRLDTLIACSAKKSKIPGLPQ